MTRDSVAILPQRPASRDDFRVAIICALPREADAVVALFDHRWDDSNDDEKPFDKETNDPNTYSLGVIGRHNVVLAHMGEIGPINAANVASCCKMSFVNIEIGLVVGVCGVVPGTDYRNRERVLGDVIISTGAIQFDSGRSTDEGLKRKTSVQDNLSKLPQQILTLLNKLMGLFNCRELEGQIIKYLAVLQREDELGANYPGKIHDRLFKSEYAHGVNWVRDKDKECQELGCSGEVVARERLLPGKEDPTPFVHFGLVASGSSVMRTGITRDKIARDESVIAFEMEGAGAWDCIPCVVIKGACDYCDSHKNKRWQPYAAAAAAACLKAFLKAWTPSGHTTAIHNAKILDEEYLERSENYLSATESNETFQQIRPVNGAWLVDHQEFKEWDSFCATESERPPALLTVNGKPFNGKSTLMKEAVLWKSKDSETITLHHFFHGGNPSGRSMVIFLRGLLGQLLNHLFQHIPNMSRTDVRRWGRKLKAGNDPGLGSRDQLEETIQRIIKENKEKLISKGKKIRIFVDGISECSDRRLENLLPERDDDDHGPLSVLQFILTLLKSTADAGIDTRVCISRRPIPEYGEREPSTRIISLEDYTSVEVEKFVKSQLKELYNSDMEHRILRVLKGKWSDDFQWARLVTSAIVERSSSVADALRIASEVPSTHIDLYETALHLVKASPRNNSRPLRILQLGLGAWRALTVVEFRQAIAYSVDNPMFESISCWERSGDGIKFGAVFESLIRRESGGLLQIATYQVSSVGVPGRYTGLKQFNSSPRVTFTHHSVISFLRGEAGLVKLYNNVEYEDASVCLDQDCHRLLFKICVAVLNQCSMREEDDKDKGIELRDYACEFWLRHAQRCGTLPPHSVPDFLCQSCKNTKIQRLMKDQIRFLIKSGSIEGLLFKTEDGKLIFETEGKIPMMTILLSSMGCTQLLREHLEKCKPCQKAMDPHSNSQSRSEDAERLNIYRLALRNAIMGSWTETALHLLKRYPPDDINSQFNKRTLLYDASYFACQTFDTSESLKRMASVEFLLENGADPCVQSPFIHEYPFHIGIVLGNMTLMKLLLRKATPEQRILIFTSTRRRNGWTALHFAIMNPRLIQKVEIFKTVVSLAPKRVGLLDILDDKGRTPMDLAKEAETHSTAFINILKDFKEDEEDDDDDDE